MWATVTISVSSVALFSIHFNIKRRFLCLYFLRTLLSKVPFHKSLAIKEHRRCQSLYKKRLPWLAFVGSAGRVRSTSTAAGSGLSFDFILRHFIGLAFPVCRLLRLVPPCKFDLSLSECSFRIQKCSRARAEVLKIAFCCASLVPLRELGISTLSRGKTKHF